MRRSSIQRIGAGALALGLGLLAARADGPRVVSLGPAITEQVCLLGAGGNLVGITQYCRLPTGAPPVAIVGEVTGISAEQVLRLKPDLVLATGMTPPRDTARLEKLGLRVVRFGYARNFDEIAAQFMELGGLLGQTNLAAAVVADARTRLAVTAARVAGLPPTRVFVEIGTKPLFTANRDSFIDDMVTRAGGENIAQNSAGGFFSREEVLARNPDVLVIVTMGVSAEAERAAWRATPALRAAASDRIHVMDAYRVCSPTPLGFAASTAELAGMLHPDAGTGAGK